MRRDFKKDRQPQGPIEEELVEHLAYLFLRRRLFPLSEAASISQSRSLGPVNSKSNPGLANQQLSRAYTNGGSVPLSSTGTPVQRAIEKLSELSQNIVTRGFDWENDLIILRGVYGNLDPYSMPNICNDLLLLMGRNHELESQYGKTDLSEELANKAVRVIDAECLRLGQLVTNDISREVTCNSLASLIPPQTEMDRILRYETQISREIERTLNQLDRLQRQRMTMCDCHRHSQPEIVPTGSEQYLDAPSSEVRQM